MAKDPKKELDMDQMIKCWTCWKIQDPTNCFKATDEIGLLTIRPVKEILNVCVPKLAVPDECFLCKKCSKILSGANEFIEKALYVEEVLRKHDLLEGKVKENGEILFHEEETYTETYDDEKEESDSLFFDGESEESFQGFESSTQQNNTLDEETRPEHEQNKEHIASSNEPEPKKKKLSAEDIKLNCFIRPIQLKNLKPLTLKCGKCTRVFPSLNAYNEHVEDIKDAPCCNYKLCELCNKKFTAEEFEKHTAAKHSQVHVCLECGKKLGSQIALASHMRNVHPKETYFCPVCYESMRTMNALQNHIKYHHPEQVNKELAKYACNRCDKKYEKKTSLDRHQKWHDNIRDFHCQHCYKSFFTSNELLSHTRLMHLYEETFFCNICGKGFVRSDYLRRHEAYHVKYQSSTCTICKKLFRSEAKLMYHMQAGHTEDGTSLELSKIDPLAHPPIRNKEKMPGHYKSKCVCKICKKVIANSFGLRVHYKSHLKLKSFKCSICGVLLQSPISLKRHEELHKDPNYKFACKICHARKNSEAELEYHENTVHKTKRYKCHLCTQAFGRRYLLDSHQATDHSDEIQKRELILEELSKETMFLDPNDDVNILFRGPKNNKGAKVGVDDSEIIEICEKVQQNGYSFKDMVETDQELPERRTAEESKIAADNLQMEDLENIGELQPEMISLKEERAELDEEEEGVQMVQDLGDGQFAIINNDGEVAQLKSETGERYAYIATRDDAGNEVVGYVQASGQEDSNEVREITEEEYAQLLKDGKCLVYLDENGDPVTLETAMEDVEEDGETLESAANEEEMQVDHDSTNQSKT